jgi:hypothetical protein
MLLRGHAQTLLRSVTVGNGVEAWRILVHRYERSDPQIQMNLLQVILKFELGDDLMKIMERLSEFEVLVDKYESIPGAERLQQSLRAAIIVQTLPEPLKSHVQMNSGTFTTYEKIKQLISDWVLMKCKVRLGTYVSDEKHAMEVDAFPFNKGKGKQNFKGGPKGKGKPGGKQQPFWQPPWWWKGKSKGKGKPVSFTGACHKCGRQGHRAVDCWARSVHEVAKEEPLAPQRKVTYLDKKPDDEEHTEYVMAMIRCDFQDWVNAVYLLMIDSGAFMHVAPKDFAMDFPLEPCAPASIVGANGSTIESYGTRQVKVTTMDGAHTKITFRIMSATRPILSVSRLVELGYGANLRAKMPYIRQGQRILRLYERAGLYFLPVRIGSPTT